MSTTNYEVNYEDERFTQVETDKQNAMTELEDTYSGMIGESDKYYQAQIDASKEWADTQSQLQQDRTDFTIEQVEQQKDQAHKNYLKEQSGAYVDWQKQSNQYGTEAERQASTGMTGTGYSESSQVSMYNTYQNRVATARESYNQAVLNYDNAIKDARLQNNAALAEIAYNALQQQLELSLQGFQYKNNLILEQANKKTELDNIYYNRYMDVLNQINHENALAEDVRQFDETLEFNATQADLDRQHSSTEAQLDREFQAKQSELDRQFEAEQAELNRQHEFAVINAKTAAEKELADHEHQLAMQELAQKYAYDQALLNQEYEMKKGQTTFNTGNTTNSESMESILALGYGPISATKLKQLVDSGEVEEYYENGVQKFRKTGKKTVVGNQTSGKSTSSYDSVVRKNASIGTRPGAQRKF
jgi:hypothetical protein